MWSLFYPLNFIYLSARYNILVLTVNIVGIPTCSQRLLTWFVRWPDYGHVRTETCSLTHNKIWCVWRKLFYHFNPFQSNFSANRILPSSYIPAIFVQAKPREYSARSPVHIKTHGLPWNRKSTTCAICWPKSVLHGEKRRTGSDSGAGTTKTCRTSSNIGAEQENHNVGQGPT